MKSYSTNWHFFLDKINTYAYYEKVFTKEECKKIIEIAKLKGLEKGTTNSNNNYSRSSKISWLFPNDNLEFAYRKITDVVLMLNKKYFQFDIFGLSEGLQFTNYKAPSAKYEKHIDRAYNFIIRKLSISIQLTDPSEYEGGELILYERDIGKEMKKEQGTLILFPSWVLHEVKPVTKGERNSLVAWVTGNQFK